MNLIEQKISIRELSRVLYNPHSWIILVILLAFVVLYYLDIRILHERIDWLFRFRSVEIINHINGILFYIPFIYAALVFRPIGMIVTWLLSMAIILPQVLYFNISATSLFTNIVFLIIPLILALLIIFILKLLKTYEERESERQAYMAQFFKTNEDERKRIAQELHDDTIQVLLAIASRLQSLLKREGNKISQQLIQQLEYIRDTIFHVTEELRKLSLDLRPSILDDIGLLEALRWLADNLSEDSVDVRLVITGVERKLPPETDVTVFRFVQEVLNNSRRHSEATDVVVNVDFGPETVKITARDNGKGFNLPKPNIKFALKGKLGIVGMEEKARLLDGAFNIDSQLGKGTSVSLEFRA